MISTNEKTPGFFKSTILFFALSFGILLSSLVGYLYYGKSEGKNVVLVLWPGTSLEQVSQLLYHEKIISNPLAFKYLLRFTGGTKRVRAGEFELRTQMKPIEALRTIYFGRPIEHQVTIPEGWTVRQIAKILSDAGLVNEKRFLDIALSRETAQKYGLNTPHLEGFLYPDTYAFSKVDGEVRIIDRMVQNFLQIYKKYEHEAKNKGFTIESLATFASIVEKETGAEGERPLIASVFHNRMEKKMRLQSDPTTIYGIENFGGNLTRRDLETYTPYNTYRIGGLPPGPIANPGESAIVATLRPVKSDFLYFVSRNDGTHVFSKSYQEHSGHVNRLQKRRMNLQGRKR